MIKQQIKLLINIIRLLFLQASLGSAFVVCNIPDKSMLFKFAKKLTCSLNFGTECMAASKPCAELYNLLNQVSYNFVKPEQNQKGKSIHGVMVKQLALVPYNLNELNSLPSAIKFRDYSQEDTIFPQSQADFNLLILDAYINLKINFLY